MFYMQKGSVEKVPDEVAKLRTKAVPLEAIISASEQDSEKSCASVHRGGGGIKWKQQIKLICVRHKLKLTDVRARAREINAIGCLTDRAAEIFATKTEERT